MPTAEVSTGYDQQLAAKIRSRLKRVFSDKTFEDPAAVKKILAPMPRLEIYLEERHQIHEERNRLGIVDFMRACHEEPLLDSDQELHLFRRYNYHKYKAMQFLESNNLRSAAIELKKSDSVSRTLTSANARLAISLVKPYLKDRRNAEDIVSEAYILIMRSVDYFNWILGNQFSTYATWVVRRGLSRFVGNLYTNNRRYVNAGEFEFDNKIANGSGYDDEIRYQNSLDLIDKVLMFCSDREQQILRMRFLEGKTLEEVGDVMGVTKERIRQIQAASLEKIRASIEIDDCDFNALFSETF